jgi:hypothetical protein
VKQHTRQAAHAERTTDDTINHSLGEVPQICSDYSLSTLGLMTPQSPVGFIGQM